MLQSQEKGQAVLVLLETVQRSPLRGPPNKKAPLDEAEVAKSRGASYEK